MHTCPVALQREHGRGKRAWTSQRSYLCQSNGRATVAVQHAPTLACRQVVHTLDDRLRTPGVVGMDGASGMVAMPRLLSLRRWTAALVHSVPHVRVDMESRRYRPGRRNRWADTEEAPTTYIRQRQLCAKRIRLA